MRTFIRAGLIFGLLVVITSVYGCGGNPATSCQNSVVITVNPTSATVNHAAAPPGNQVQFIAVGRYAAAPGCAAPQLAWIAYGNWSNPDPIDITISSANDSTNGTAVCKAPTNGSVTLTGAFTESVTPPQSVNQSVQLACE